MPKLDVGISIDGLRYREPSTNISSSLYIEIDEASSRWRVTTELHTPAEVPDSIYLTLFKWYMLQR